MTYYKPKQQSIKTIEYKEVYGAKVVTLSDNTKAYIPYGTTIIVYEDKFINPRDISMQAI